MNPLNLLEDPLRGLLNFLHDSAHLTYGWSIVVLTVIVRTILLPLVIKQYKSMRAMQMVAPQLKELQRKHKGNRQKLNEELMAFYKDNEINPFASCLPLVAQIPVFISLYYVLKQFARNAHGGDLSFMWVVPDITQQLQDIGWGAAVIVAIYALSQLLSTELSATPNMPDSQRRIMRILPLVIVLFVFQFPVPSGLVIYWMTTNLWTAGQQLVMRHRIGLHLADPEEVARFNALNEKRSSRTPPKEEAPAPVAEERPASTPRRRRRRGAEDGAAPAEAVAEPALAGEPVDAPEPDLAPEPETAPEPESAPEPAADGPDPSAEPAAPVPSGGGANGRSPGTPRRQPRPKGSAKGSRPAQPGRAKKRKR